MALSREYLEEALKAAKKHLPGWAYAQIHMAARPASGGRAKARPLPEAQLCEKCRVPIEPAPITKHELPAGALPVHGSVDARVVFVGAAPTPLDTARGEPLTGAAGKLFTDTYLRALDLTRDQIVIAHLIPTAVKSGDPDPLDVTRWRAWLEGELAARPSAMIVALGQVAKSALGDRAVAVLPHPRAVAQRLANGRADAATTRELVRKLGKLREVLRDSKTPETGAISATGADPIQGAAGGASEPSDPGNGAASGDAVETHREVRIVKADAAEQVVLGVVLDPYMVDAQNDWVPPKQVEATAEAWLTKSRVIGLNHGGKANAVPIQSYTVPYPSERDHDLAMQEQPHRVQRIKVGDQQVHSGAWLLKVKVHDTEAWTAIQKGEITGYSIGGFSTREAVPKSAMPKVEYVDG